MCRVLFQLQVFAQVLLSTQDHLYLCPASLASKLIICSGTTFWKVPPYAPWYPNPGPSPVLTGPHCGCLVTQLLTSFPMSTQHQACHRAKIQYVNQKKKKNVLTNIQLMYLVLHKILQWQVWFFWVNKPIFGRTDIYEMCKEMAVALYTFPYL